MREVQREKGDLPYLSSNYIATTSQTRINNEQQKGEMGRQWTGSEMGKKIKENKYPGVVPDTHQQWGNLRLFSLVFPSVR